MYSRWIFIINTCLWGLVITLLYEGWRPLFLSSLPCLGRPDQFQTCLIFLSHCVFVCVSLANSIAALYILVCTTVALTVKQESHKDNSKCTVRKYDRKRKTLQTIQLLVLLVLLVLGLWTLNCSSTRAISLNRFAVPRSAVTHTRRSQDYKLLSCDGAVRLTHTNHVPKTQRIHLKWTWAMSNETCSFWIQTSVGDLFKGSYKVRKTYSTLGRCLLM